MAAVRYRLRNKQHAPLFVLEATLEGYEDAQNVWGDVMRCFADEVETELVRLKGKKRIACNTKCNLCPFRAFQSRPRLVEHIRKYHTKERLFIANGRNQFQWDLAVALYNQCRQLAVLEPTRPPKKFLQNAAAMIAKWISPGEAALRHLKKNNELDLAMVLTFEGPKLMLKPQVSAHKRVLNTYYDSAFASLVLSLAVRHAGKAKAVMEAVTSHFVAEGSPCAGLLKHSGNADLREAIVAAILQSPEVNDLRTKLLAQATRNGEWTVVTHDGTHQVLFRVIGQVKMAQREGESHVMHTLMGRTGALPRISLQPKEGKEYFKKASEENLPRDARYTTKWVFSDSPSSVEGSADV